MPSGTSAATASAQPRADRAQPAPGKRECNQQQQPGAQIELRLEHAEHGERRRRRWSFPWHRVSDQRDGEQQPTPAQQWIERGPSRTATARELPRTSAQSRIATSSARSRWPRRKVPAQPDANPISAIRAES
jgi:hypothetical protein